MCFAGYELHRAQAGAAIFRRSAGKKIPYFDLRHHVKPGITGWAQVMYPYGASVEDAYHKLEYDLYYTKNISLPLDLLILAKTVGVVLKGEGDETRRDRRRYWPAVLLSGLRELSQAGQPLDITAIVTAADSGGSTGVLRDAFKMPAMGDIRKCMISLAAEESVLASVCRYRFESPDGIAGHSLGNLILTALYEMSGSFTGAVRQAGDLLHLKDRVLPATEVPVTLCVRYDDGGLARGESNIPQPGRRIRQVWLESGNSGTDYAPPAAGVIEADPGSRRDRHRAGQSLYQHHSQPPGCGRC